MVGRKKILFAETTILEDGEEVSTERRRSDGPGPVSSCCYHLN